VTDPLTASPPGPGHGIAAGLGLEVVAGFVDPRGKTYGYGIEAGPVRLLRPTAAFGLIGTPGHTKTAARLLSGR
jgi:hypothetical protein